MQARRAESQRQGRSVMSFIKCYRKGFRGGRLRCQSAVKGGAEFRRIAPAHRSSAGDAFGGADHPLEFLRTRVGAVDGGDAIEQAEQAVSVTSVA